MPSNLDEIVFHGIRFLPGSVCREAQDYYLLISEKQIIRILHEYIDYYNSKRPHQGIDRRIPMGYKPQLHGRVQDFPILDGFMQPLHEECRVMD